MQAPIKSFEQILWVQQSPIELRTGKVQSPGWATNAPMPRGLVPINSEPCSLTYKKNLQAPIKGSRKTL